METYRRKDETIIDLHERGFTEDVVFMGDNLYWIQQRELIRPGDFKIMEYHRVESPNGGYAVICGILSHRFPIKAILMCCSQTQMKTVSTEII